MMTADIATDVAQLEDDRWMGVDGDNSTLQLHVPEAKESDLRILQATKPPRKKLVRFVRRVKLGSRGYDVRAIKRALAKAGHGKWIDKPSLLFGPFARKSLKGFQKEKGLPQTGVYDLATHKKLAPYFDNYGVWLLLHTRKKGGESLNAERHAVVATAIFGYGHRGEIHYTQTSLRMDGVKHHIKPPSVPHWEDCSSYATWCYWVAGAPDPNRLGYSGWGYTGTLASHGLHISIAQMRPGDLIFYGGGFPYHHVAIYIGNGKVISHGSEGGPFLLPYNYRSDISTIRSYL